MEYHVEIFLKERCLFFFFFVEFEEVNSMKFLGLPIIPPPPLECNAIQCDWKLMVSYAARRMLKDLEVESSTQRVIIKFKGFKDKGKIRGFFNDDGKGHGSEDFFLCGINIFICIFFF